MVEFFSTETITILSLTVAIVFGIATIIFGLTARKERNESKREREEARKYREMVGSYLKANVRLGETVDLSGGVTGRIIETEDGNFAIERSLQLEDRLTLRDEVHVEKIPAERDKGDSSA